MGVELALHGYICMSIDYRLWNTGVKSPTWPQSLFDAKTAVRWLRTEAVRLQVDPERIGVFGNSAGGNLAAMLAVTTPDDGLEPAAPLPGVSTRVKCAIDFYGALDLPNYHDMKMFLQTRAENPAIYRKASPVTYVKSGAAPMLLIHG
ncbi:MAG: alpha/beta hydrolase, partial [Verrucomicrobia bacterium]|nr:alpha/beta hydrolase [Verrucomicrobiota bacterium]NDE99588.1 alpha/beta hydrolase [Verrucomicrobiota bacterium]